MLLSITGQGTIQMTKKPKISRRKAKIICFEASNYGKKKVKNLEISEKNSIFKLNSLQEHFESTISKW